MATHVVHSTERSGLWRTLPSAWALQNTEFLLNSSSFCLIEKWASSLNHIFWRKSDISSILLSNHCHTSTCFAMTFCVRVCWRSGLYMNTTEGYSLRFCEWTNKKDRTLESISRVTFSDSKQQNLELRGYSLAFLQSPFCHLLITSLF